jgi:hypothetical protein
VALDPRPEYTDFDGRQEVKNEIEHEKEKYTKNFDRAMKNSPQPWQGGFMSYLAGDRYRIGIVPKPPPAPEWSEDRPPPPMRFGSFETTVKGLPNDVHRVSLEGKLYQTRYCSIF